MKIILFVVTVKQPIIFSKQPIIFSKQPIVFPLAPLYNAAKFAYAWLNLFLFFISWFWTNIHWVCHKIW